MQPSSYDASPAHSQQRVAALIADTVLVFAYMLHAAATL